MWKGKWKTRETGAGDDEIKDFVWGGGDCGFERVDLRGPACHVCVDELAAWRG